MAQTSHTRSVRSAPGAEHLTRGHAVMKYAYKISSKKGIESAGTVTTDARKNMLEIIAFELTRWVAIPIQDVIKVEFEIL
jgi:hypothetical protein